ncbi:MAG: ABC transporter permease [Euzebyales bacterium]|jgi:ribose transport system permease protein|nr:ABC transporter permease [Euzebyales bacterium]
MADTSVVSRGHRSGVSDWLRERGVYVALALVLALNLAVTSNFASTGSIVLQLIEVVPILLVALGLSLVIGTEGIDLSVGSVMAIAAGVLPLYLGYGAVPAILITLAVGALVGLLNGTLVALVGIQPIVATLGVLVGGRGLAQVIAGGQQQRISDDTIRALGSLRLAGVLPVSVLIAFSAVLVISWVTRRTTFGRHVVAVGGNRRASRFSGLPVRRTLLGVYVLSAVLAALAGILATARLGASDTPNVGQLIELSGITAVVVGGTPLSGGRVRILGTVAGALLMQLLNATFIMNNLPYTYAQMIQAVIILVAIYAQRPGVSS